MPDFASTPPAAPDRTAPSATGVAPSQAGKIAVALATVYLVWGSTYLGIRIAIESIPPLLMAGCRFGLAGALMIAFAHWVLRKPWPSARQWRDAAIVGSCLLLAGNGGVTLAERHLPSGVTAMLVATVPMFLLLFGWLAGMSPRPGAITCFGLALGFVGVCLLLRPASGTLGTIGRLAPADLYTSGTLVLLASALWAAGSLYSKRADKPASAVLNVGTQMLAGGALLGLASALTGEWPFFHLGAVSARSLWAFLYLVFVGAVVGFSAYIWVLGVASPSLVGTYAFVNPVVAVVLGWSLAGEAINATMLLGMGTIVSAVGLIVLFPAAPRVRPPAR